MSMAASTVPVSFAGGNHTKNINISAVNPGAFVKSRQLTFQSKTRSPLCVRAQQNDQNSGSGAHFVAGFVLGGAVFGTLATVFAPQIRRTLLNENEAGFKRATKPIYYDDEGLETTRYTLNEKIRQLNSAIDNVASRLRGGNKWPPVPVDPDAEEAVV
ncbi:expressed protein localized to the inner membraneof the chloroplast [Striga asiatica]|uniref:Expressed protein localized to the inner membraneof the chloroplast n=1 Tax=Striga asiatica TaxID=4170 RepID=A0A5A7QUY2_STRAF|nr:expressed protein localized to the inner membraneof the chloroplast [Striga asiatica]